MAAKNQLNASFLLATACFLFLVTGPQACDEKLTYSMPQATLKETLAGLNHPGESPLLPSSSLAKRPAMVYVRGKSRVELMNDLAWFYTVAPGKCIWDTSTPGRAVLRDDATGQRARRSRMERQKAQRYRTLVSEIETGLKLGLLPDQQLITFRNRNPELVWATPRRRHVFGILASLNPAQRETLLSGAAVTLKMGELEPREQQYARELLKGLRRRRLTAPLMFDGGYIEWQVDRDFPTTPIVIRLTGKPDHPDIKVVAVPIPGSQSGVYDLIHPKAPPASERPEWLNELLTKQEQEAQKKRQKFLEDVRRNPLLTRKITVKTFRMVPDPAQPGKTIKRFCGFSDSMLQVADGAALSVLGDFDPCWEDYYSHLDPFTPNARMATMLRDDLVEKPVWEVMESLSQLFMVEWGIRGSTIWVRSPRTEFAMMDGIEVVNPPHIPGYFQRLKAKLKPGERIPGVVYPQ